MDAGLQGETFHSFGGRDDGPPCGKCLGQFDPHAGAGAHGHHHHARRVVRVGGVLHFAEHDDATMGVGNPSVGHVASSQFKSRTLKRLVDHGPDLVLQPHHALDIGGPIHGPEMQGMVWGFTHVVVGSTFDIQTKRKRNDP